MDWIEIARGWFAQSEPGAAARRGPLALALQGGGSFGAFAWGVLDRLLDEPEIAIEAISGASAGAVNATLIASGLLDGGRAEAKAKLARFWKRMSQAAAFLPNAAFANGPLNVGLGLWARSLAPRQFNPFNLNPLREALAAEVDFEALRERSRIKLLIGATRARDGQLKLFETGELTLDAVLASACLPLLHHAVVIDGETYWDGGYAANPPLLPLVIASEAERLLIVQVTPNMTERVPTAPAEIARRIEQIQFNATLNRELEALKYAKVLGVTPKMRRLRIGRIAAHDEIADLADESAANLDWSFLERLRDSGRAAVEAWLEQSTAGPPGA